jgi:ABC-type lipoprotein release transport system permease subunit
LIIGEAGWTALAGISLGPGVTFGVTQLASSLLVGVTATDPAVAAIILLGVTLIAGYLPARRAGLIPPMSALRRQ